MWSSPPPCWSHGLFGICKPTPGSTNRAGLAFPLNWINRNQDGDVGIEERWGKKTYLKPWWGCTRCDSCTGCHPGEKIFKTINFWRKRFNCDHLPHASAGIVEDVLDLVQLCHPVIYFFATLLYFFCHPVIFIYNFFATLLYLYMNFFATLL